jgi:hypothetical protein
MSINIQSLISLAEFFFRTPVEKAEIDFTNKALIAGKEVFALQSVQDMLESGAALITAEGWTVGRNSQTNTIETITPPVAAPQPDVVGRQHGGGLMGPGA